ncbi:MAG TPA: hypothetical protein VEK76_14025 [Candidatus Binatia bacterium]|nr:hypothetical protein [Candidatus Binatia bacterium]
MAVDPRFRPRRPQDDRPRPHPPTWGGPPPSRPAPDPAAVMTSLRLREGEREIEVSGTAAFVRQVLDDLPALVARLRGEAAATPASIRMPAPSPREVTVSPAPNEETRGDAPGEAVGRRSSAPARGPAPTGKGTPGADGETAASSVEERVLAALRTSPRPLPVATIRSRVGGAVSGQQVRRILERAGSKVVATSDRPIRYRLR